MTVTCEIKVMTLFQKVPQQRCIERKVFEYKKFPNGNNIT